jgi:HAE1 family hydrophobic/amphiphilic exporter-1
LRRVNSVLGYYRKGGPGSMALTMDVMMDSLFTLPYPPGYGMEQRGDMTQMMDSFNRLLIGLGVALAFIYLSLIVQFRSLLQPLALMAAIPLELVGVFGGLLVAHQTFSTVSILGLVVLNGMDVTASILLIDLIATRRDDGLDRRQAVEEAGPMRLRPIVMTVLVTLVVMLPVALFPRTGIDAYSPLATVVVGGLAMSTILTLVVVPVLYTLVDDLEAWLAGWRHGRTDTGRADKPLETG